MNSKPWHAAAGRRANNATEKVKAIMTDHTTTDEQWVLRLYVAGQTPKSLTAFANLKKVCETHLHEQYQIEVIDLAENPQQARTDEIVVTPTLVRKLPPPLRRIIGDLSNIERVLVGLELKPRE